jgi:hypothetical protein
MEAFGIKKSLATTYFPTPRGRSIIGVRGLDFRVRYGNGYATSTIITRQLLALFVCRVRNNNMVKPHGRLVLVG